MTAEEITVRLRDPKGEPLPVAGVHLDIRFYVEGRFRYSFSLGRTDVHGVCRSTFEGIEQQLEANRRLFLMDYNTPLSDCDTAVGIAAPATGELIEREAARAKLWPEESSTYVGAANDRVRCPEQKFELRGGSDNTFELICDVEARSDILKCPVSTQSGQQDFRCPTAPRSCHRQRESEALFDSLNSCLFPCEGRGPDARSASAGRSSRYALGLDPGLRRGTREPHP